MCTPERINWELELALRYYLFEGKTLYFLDDDGNEYWYSPEDGKRYYTRDEG